MNILASKNDAKNNQFSRKLNNHVDFKLNFIRGCENKIQLNITHCSHIIAIGTRYSVVYGHIDASIQFNGATFLFSRNYMYL